MPLTKNSLQAHFPTGIYDMLEEAESRGHSHILSWCNGGQSFKIHCQDMMIPILKSHFCQTKYKSFLRQLQLYGFTRITRGENKGMVSHPLLIRGKRFLCLKMKRKIRGAGTANKQKQQQQQHKLLSISSSNHSLNSSSSSRSLSSSSDSSRSSYGIVHPLTQQIRCTTQQILSSVGVPVPPSLVGFPQQQQGIKNGGAQRQRGQQALQQMMVMSRIASTGNMPLPSIEDIASSLQVKQQQQQTQQAAAAAAAFFACNNNPYALPNDISLPSISSLYHPFMVSSLSPKTNPFPPSSTSLRDELMKKVLAQHELDNRSFAIPFNETNIETGQPNDLSQSNL